MPRRATLGTLPAVRLTTIALAALLAPAAAGAAQKEAAGAESPGGLTVTGSLAGGSELGLSSGQAGLLEAEAIVGYEFQPTGLRPELGAVLGLAPSGHLGLRPGLRWSLPAVPIQLRAALDWSNVRDDFAWRWLLLGAAGEIRMTSLFGLFVEFDTGAPLTGHAGVPLLLRVGASFRL